MTWNKGKGKGIAFLREHVNDEDGDCLMWPMACDNHGYPIMGFNGKLHKAASLMCKMAHGTRPTPKHHTAHSCGRGQEGCVHPKHVRWATPKENMADSVRLGAVRQKGKRPFHKLTEEQVAQIMALKGTAPYTVIGPMFGVKPKQIGKIYRGEQWKGGKKTFGGFKPGDARNPFARNPRVKGHSVSAAEPFCNGE